VISHYAPLLFEQEVMMLRDYQQRAIDQLYAWFAAGNEGNPCLVLPTGAGKSHIIAALVKDALQNWPETRVLMLTHVKELIQQNAEKMREHWPNAPMGIYSASLGRRCLTEPITFAGIQSVASKATAIGHVDLILVDEAHSINHAQTGGYRKLITSLTSINPALRVIGLTATPYRLGHGMIHEGEDVLFNDLIEPISIEELIHRGYLSKLRSKHTSLTLDTSGVKKQGGEFVAAQLEAAVDTSSNNRRAVAEVINRASDRRSWLVFCAGVAHAHHVASEFTAQGVPTEVVTGETPSAERAAIIARFKSGEIRALCNVSVLSTGFDYPGIDCLVMLRPTMSPGLYVQIAGRGLRIAEGKSDCLVLDFAGNVARHGPITAVEPPQKAKKGEALARTKTCPRCEEMVAPNTRECPHCGHVWEVEEQAKPVTLANDDIMGIEPSEMALTGWAWRKHTSRASGKDMLQVSYYGGISEPPVTEYIPVLHEGYAGEKARRQLIAIAVKSGANDLSDDLSEMAKVMQQSTPPSILKFKRDGKFHRVIDRVWA
jgi:DNA repair protein RadD